MFLQENTNAGGPNNLSEIIGKLQSELKSMQSAVFNFDTQAKKIAADTFGQGAEFAKNIRIELGKSAKNAAELGFTINDVADTLNSIAGIFGTNLVLSSKQLDNMMAFQAATNVSSETMGKLVEGFSTIGFGINDAMVSLENIRKQTNAYGLNTAKFMETVGENVKLMNSYNFRDGVEGFTRMVARSQALRINMTDVKGLAADLLNPEKAIELAASMQMLGGSVGALADPFQLMNMAQNDMDGLQQSIVDAAASSVTFNENTGKFNLSATEMRRLRAQAQALGMDYEELADTAVKSRMKQEAMGQLRFTNLSKEEQEFLSNIGQFEGGELKFKVPGVDELVAASDLDAEQIQKLRDQQADGEKDALEIAKEQLTALQRIQATLLMPVIQAQGIAASGLPGGPEDKLYFDRLAATLDATADAIAGKSSEFLSEENIEAFLETRDDILGTFKTQIEGANNLGDIIGAAGTAVSSATAAATDAAFGAGTAQDISNAVQTGFQLALQSVPLNINHTGNITLGGVALDLSTLTPQQKEDLRNFIINTLGRTPVPL